MKAIIQRTKDLCRIESRLSSEEVFSSEFNGPGLVVLLGWQDIDEERGAGFDAKEHWLIERILGLRVFPDKEDKMNLSLSDYVQANPTKEAGILWVPQFTLSAELKSGFRPSFTKAMRPQVARSRFAIFKQKMLAQETPPLKHIFGYFGADMLLHFTNWGPVTIPLEV